MQGWSSPGPRCTSSHGLMVRPDEGASAPLAEPVSHPVTEPVLTGTDAGSPSIGTGRRPRRKGRLSRRRLKDWRVRTRLLLLIAIPTLTALVFGVIRIASATQSALAFQRAEERAILASTISQLTQRLETERDQTIYYIALGGNGRAGDHAKARSAATSGAAAQYRGLHAFYLQ